MDQIPLTSDFQYYVVKLNFIIPIDLSGKRIRPRFAKKEKKSFLFIVIIIIIIDNEEYNESEPSLNIYEDLL